MKQRIYDSRAQEIVELDTRVAGEVGLYVCGPTVQSSPHIGHLRSALVYDQIRRWLRASGYRVTLIRNVTDIDDKILERAASTAGGQDAEQWWQLAYRVEREFTAAYDAIGILPPSYEPRATASIGEMIALISLLIERGHAYASDEHGGSVYFDTASWPDYGALTRQRREHMDDAEDSEPAGKRDPRDFALWKATRPGEPESASWASPWGPGRPGWHIECSAMAVRYLGESFDIHGGGLDLRFPHHENEVAQSNAAGHPFARYWLHNGLVSTGGRKMSKSLGNSVFAHDLLGAARPLAVRYLLGSAHYRSVLEVGPGSLEEADAALSRVEAFLSRAMQVASGEAAEPGTASALEPRRGRARAEEMPAEFVRALLEDFAVPQALAVLHGTVRAGNVALDSGDAAHGLARAREVVSMLDVLGLDAREAGEGAGAARIELESAALARLVDGLLDERRAARETRDFATSDAIRDRLVDAGISLEDTPTGTRWSVE